MDELEKKIKLIRYMVTLPGTYNLILYAIIEKDFDWADEMIKDTLDRVPEEDRPAWMKAYANAKNADGIRTDEARKFGATEALALFGPEEG